MSIGSAGPAGRPFAKVLVIQAWTQAVSFVHSVAVKPPRSTEARNAPGVATKLSVPSSDHGIGQGRSA